ncbi:MAG: FHA domain-containing protein [Planctomycetota bacterium]
MARLIQTDGEHVGAEYPLGDRTAMGRGSDSQIVMAEKKASRHHAVILHREGEYVMADLESKNGTCVNGRRYRVKHLHAGDVIRVGRTLFEFYLTEDDPPSQRGRLAVGVIEDDSINPTNLGRFHVGRLLQDEEGLQVESSAAAEVKIGPGFRAACAMEAAQDERDVCEALGMGISSLFEHVDRCAILFREPDGGALIPMLTLNHTDDKDDIVVPLSIVRPCLEEGEAILAKDAVAELGYTEETGADLLKTISLAASPIMTRQGCSGVLYADTITRGFYFTPEDLHLLVLAGILAADKLTRVRKARR